eukprot:gene20262-29721_t
MWRSTRTYVYEFTVHEPENCTAIAAAAEISTDVTVQLQFMKDTSPIDGKCSNIAATFTMMPVPHTMWRLLTSLALLAVVVPGADGGYPNAAAKPLLAEVKGMFDHGYEGYLKQGNVTEFKRAVNLVTTNVNFTIDRNVSVFSSHRNTDSSSNRNTDSNTDSNAKRQPEEEADEVEESFQYDGRLLEMAIDLAFDTPTSIPIGTVNLMHGVPPGETTITSLAGAGTYLLEF